ncbi:MAG: NAD(P)/FAD-dependent oxidoreductase [Edaphobacter sp.]
MGKQVIIIGAGPAGLTAALEFLRRSDVVPVVLEASHEIGGLSRTVRYKGNRMDIGGHRFFSKSDRVMQWWMDLMPPEAEDRDTAQTISYQGKHRVVAGPLAIEGGPGTAESAPPEDADLVMLIRPRKSRIYYLRKFFDYPITLTADTLANLGLVRTFKVGTSYLKSRMSQIKPEKSLEDFLINRFGRQLYLMFFKSYTEKVWGTPCDEISAEWGAQRIKDLNLTTAVKHFVKRTLRGDSRDGFSQKQTDTSLIERFMYPKFGPGQLWENVAGLVRNKGGEVRLGWRVDGIHCDGKRVVSINAVNDAGERQTFAGDYFFSTMPMRELVRAIDVPVPDNVREVSDGLQYRDFITVGLLADRLKVHEPDGGLLKDTWIYVQEPDVLLGRLQIFNNWSPYLVADPGKVWIGLEYFVCETDDLWKMTDAEVQNFAIAEVAKIGILNAEDVTDGHVVRVPKTYPSYFGTYDRFDELRAFTDGFENLFLVGRNGMHRYNNQDHSILTAMTAVDGILAGKVNKAALWGINTEQEYHEEKIG